MKSAERIFEVLEVLTTSQEIRIRDIVNITDLNKATVHRILQALISLGYVSYNEGTQAYSLTFKIAKLTQSLMENFSITALANKYILKLHEDVMQTIHLTMFNGSSIIYLDKKDAHTKGIKISSYIGKTEDLHSTASGKLFLANLESEDFIKLWQSLSLRAKTQNTITDQSKMLQELEKVKQQKYALDNHENEENTACIAMPIYDFNGKCLYTVSITIADISNYQDTIEKLVSFKPYLTDCCNNITQKLIGS